MPEIKIAEYIPALAFECPYCGEYNLESYSLKPDWMDGAACNSDTIACEHCGKDVKVVERL